MEERLLEAAENGKLQKVKELLDGGANVNATDEDSWTALHWAAYKGNKDIAKVLLDHGAEVNATDKWGYTPLHYAAYHGYLDIAKELIAHGANVNIRDNDGFTALYWAEKQGHQAVAKVLKKARGNRMKNKKQEIQSTPNNIINALKQGSRLTTMEAMTYLGTTKLLSRISDLRRQGWNIVGDWKKSTNRYGRPVRFKVYRLARPFKLNGPYKGI